MKLKPINMDGMNAAYVLLQHYVCNAICIFLNPLWKMSLSDSITIKCHTQSILSSIFRSCDPEIRLDILLSDPVKSHENRLIIISVKAWVGIQGCLWGIFNPITHHKNWIFHCNMKKTEDDVYLLHLILWHKLDWLWQWHEQLHISVSGSFL